ncbi:molybdopterin cofactor-binding domain-containing protein [Methylobacterium sp. NFXW15]|uniref:molybdopterin cofactor-binding domain-containing protein n=1 Tax=Methylobacterium sp. NFXW15 TaxID=2819512 RepID=UPI003CF8EEE8
MEMNQPIGRTPLDDRAEGLVGKPLDRVDGPLKVTGRAPYAYESRALKNPVYGYIVTATVAAGTITALDAEAARKAPGTIFVMTHENVPEQGEKKEQVWPQLQGREVKFYGQPIAFVVAETFEQARAAAMLVTVIYDKAKPKGLLRENLSAAYEPKPMPTSPGVKPDSALGDFDGAFAKSPVQIDVEYTTPTQIHAQMEPHATIAEWQSGPDGDAVVLYSANQMPNRNQPSVGSVLKIAPDKVRFVTPYIGGGFGSKLQSLPEATLAALASKVIKRPVKVTMTRQQEFHVGTHRTDTIQRVRLGADNDGRLTAIAHESWSDTAIDDGFYETSANVTRSLYAAPNRITRHRMVNLNLPIASSMRAPGEAVGQLAFECAMDELAERLNIDPVELRIRNEPQEDPEKKVPFSTRRLVDCMKEGAARFEWDKRGKPGATRDGQWLIGLGMSAAARQNPLKPSAASVRLGPDGVLTVRMAMTDLGTGTYTILTQIGGEMMGLPPEKVRVELGDTNFPKSAGSGGSFGAASAGSALYVACDNLRQALVAKSGLDAGEAQFAHGAVSAGGRSVPFTDLVGSEGLEAKGEIKPGEMEKKFSQYSFGAHFAEVGVDIDTGEVRLRRMLGCFTGGRILNEKTARSQAIGGMIFGVGAALMEDAVIDPRYSYYVNHDLGEYHVSTHADVPNVDAFFLPELDDKANPLKSKGLGELGICGAGASVANAIYNATGIRIRDYPMTLDKVLKGLEERETQRRT